MVAILTICLTGCSATIFRGNWRYTAELAAHARMEAERMKPPATPPPIIEEH